MGQSSNYKILHTNKQQINDCNNKGDGNRAKEYLMERYIDIEMNYLNGIYDNRASIQRGEDILSCNKRILYPQFLTNTNNDQLSHYI